MDIHLHLRNHSIIEFKANIGTVSENTQRSKRGGKRIVVRLNIDVLFELCKTKIEKKKLKMISNK